MGYLPTMCGRETVFLACGQRKGKIPFVMTLETILGLIAAALLYAAFLPPRTRGYALLIASVAALYLLQPPLPIRFSDFLLPTLTLLLAVCGWWWTRDLRLTLRQAQGRPTDDLRSRTALSRDDWLTLGLSFGVVMALSLFRYIPAEYRLTPSRPPSPLAIFVFLSAFLLLTRFITRRTTHYAPRLTFPALLILLLFILLKTEPFAAALSFLGRTLTGQDESLAAAGDLNWLGFSYLAFRLLHTLRDRQTGLLPDLSLREYLTYALFFPALAAGPIDRAERFTPEYRALPELNGLDATRWLDGLIRIGTGLFKKFVIADTLAQGVALNPTLAAQAQSTPWLWVLLYGYAFRLFFDFSGYSDIAIGLGLLFGIRLPENFDYPYLKTNLTSFWQSWHITLSNWARFYVFSPLSRWLLKRPVKPSPTVIVLTTQLATMITIGLWHGVSWNFLIWGLWHGVGLFVHKEWSGRTRPWHRSLNDKPAQKRLWNFLTWFLTFHYVVIGWVWFLLPTPTLAAHTILRLFGRGW